MKNTTTGTLLKPWRIFHPFFFVLYPILAIYSKNIDEIPPSVLVRPVITSFALALLILLLLRLIFKDWNRAGLVASWIFILFLYFDYYDKIPRKIHLGRFVFSHDWPLLAFWSISILFISSPWLWKRIGSAVVTRYLNIVSGVLMVFALGSLAISVYQAQFKDSELHLKSDLHPQPASVDQAALPDIYYIIVDGYGRADMLQTYYGVDNSPFIDYLKKRGFYVASQSQSNYMQTALSLSSSMNLSYLEFEENVTKSRNKKPLKDLIKNTFIRKFLESQGYRFVTMQTGFENTTIPDADIYFPYQYQGISEFESLYINSIGVRYLFDRLHLSTTISGNQKHRDRIRFEFEQLKKIPTIRGHKFVFVHFIAPHPPFLFDSQGNPVNDDKPYWIGDGSSFRGSSKKYIQGYSQQIIYINQLLEETIDAILAGSPKPPVILLQGDHGPGAYLDWDSYEKTCLKERFSILNAYYLPGADDKQLYDTISPVNSFRVVINEYFHTGLETLGDRHYYSQLKRPYDFIDATGASEEECNLAQK